MFFLGSIQVTCEGTLFRVPPRSEKFLYHHQLHGRMAVDEDQVLLKANSLGNLDQKRVKSVLLIVCKLRRKKLN